MRKSVLNDKNEIISKIQQHVYKLINKSIDIAKDCSCLDILLCIVQYHFIRYSENKEYEGKINLITKFREVSCDSIKYVIQLLLKYSSRKDFEKFGDNIKNELLKTTNLIQLANEITTYAENISLIQLSDDVSFTNEQKNIVRNNFEDFFTKKGIKEFAQYHHRVDYSNSIEVNSFKTENEMYDYFRNEYLPYAKLFEEETLCTIDDYIALNKSIIKIISDKLHNVESKLFYDSNGCLQLNDLRNYLLLIPNYLLYIKELLDNLDKRQSFLLRRLILESKDIDIYNLKYYEITRKPFINVNGFLFICPEFLLESICLNTHYSLLENSSVKQTYIKQASDIFVAKIESLATKYGFSTFMKEHNLYEGKRCIGDLDIVLKRDEFFLIIEAKNYNLPLNVYFHDLDETKKYKDYLIQNWEKHIIERNNYVKNHFSDLGMSSNFKYIYVTRCPEILSHFSSFLCLSFNEFEFYLKNQNTDISFEKIYEALYDQDMQDDITTLTQKTSIISSHIWFDKE